MSKRRQFVATVGIEPWKCVEIVRPIGVRDVVLKQCVATIDANPATAIVIDRVVQDVHLSPCIGDINAARPVRVNHVVIDIHDEVGVICEDSLLVYIVNEVISHRD